MITYPVGVYTCSYFSPLDDLCLDSHCSGLLRTDYLGGNIYIRGQVYHEGSASPIRGYTSIGVSSVQK
jgi:hypothetical protein